MTPPAALPTADAIDDLRAIGREFHGRGWSLGTSSNDSVIVSRNPLELLVTVSVKDTSALPRDDFVRVECVASSRTLPSGHAAMQQAQQ